MKIRNKYPGLYSLIFHLTYLKHWFLCTLTEVLKMIFLIFITSIVTKLIEQFVNIKLVCIRYDFSQKKFFFYPKGYIIYTKINNK